MGYVFDHPFLLLPITFVTLWLSVHAGALLRRRLRPVTKEQRDDFGVVSNAILTLAGLILGFSFSMALERYDQRKNLEEAEANAIGTEYVRSDLLPAADAARVRKLLQAYIEQRVLFYTVRDEARREEIDADTTSLQRELWASVKSSTAQPSSVSFLVISGMNDVLNSQGYTQAAWWNRLPYEAWGLMAFMAVTGSVVLGYGVRRFGGFLTLLFPLAVSVAFFLIADIDSPNVGLVRVLPQNLLVLSQSSARP